MVKTKVIRVDATIFISDCERFCSNCNFLEHKPKNAIGKVVCSLFDSQLDFLQDPIRNIRCNECLESKSVRKSKDVNHQN